MLKKLVLLLIVCLAGCGPDPQQYNERISQVRESGYKAGLAGQPPQANPHPRPSYGHGGSFHIAWEEGWLDGDSDRRLKNKEGAPDGR